MKSYYVLNNIQKYSLYLKKSFDNIIKHLLYIVYKVEFEGLHFFRYSNHSKS